MKLLDILLHELEDWPAGKKYAYQSAISPVAYFESSVEDADPKAIRLCQIAPERGIDHKVSRGEWEVAKIKALPFFKDVSAILGEGRAVKELLAVGKINTNPQELNEAFAFAGTPQGFDFWRDISEPTQGRHKLKHALNVITAAMKKANPKHCIRLQEDGSGSVRDHDDNEIVYFSNLDALVNKYLAPTHKFDHWDLLQDRFNWIAKDCEGNWWAYDDKPIQSDVGWTPNGAFRSLGSLKIEIPCHWSHSLISRS